MTPKAKTFKEEQKEKPGNSLFQKLKMRIGS